MQQANPHEVLTEILTHLGLPAPQAIEAAGQIIFGLTAHNLVIAPPTSGEFGPMAEAATQLHEGFDQLIQKGFTREEAYGLVQTMMGTMGRNA
ncbi:hypothetical protein PBI_CLEO_53 [Gordonia phage Cleo]|nr:hypothetical protein PBI_CLEO_53 [Gordonia phage Cleo]